MRAAPARGPHAEFVGWRESRMAQSLRHVLDLSDSEWVRLERIAGRFEEAWRRGERPALDDYLPSEWEGDRRSVLERT